MRPGLRPVFVLLSIVALGLSQDDPLARPWQGEKKLILVITPDWNASRGTLARYERVEGSWHWKKIGEPIPVVVGQNGLAWDPALTRRSPGDYQGPIKHEGDRRSPAGVFQLKRGTFGFAPSLSGSRMYIPLTPTIECVDDPASRYYGRIVDRAEVDRVDWKSSEKMASIPEYRWGVVVNYNMDQQVPRDGSCIFLHQWNGPTSSTAGCTAMSGEDIEQVVRWVNGDGRAVLVQLPEPEYQRLRTHWQLP